MTLTNSDLRSSKESTLCDFVFFVFRSEVLISDPISKIRVPKWPS